MGIWGRIVFDLAWKAVRALDHVEQHHVVGFEAFRTVDGLEADVEEIAVSVLPSGQIAWLIASVTAKEQNFDLAACAKLEPAVLA